MKDRVDELNRFKEDAERQLYDMELFRSKVEKDMQAFQTGQFENKNKKHVLNLVGSPIQKRREQKNKESMKPNCDDCLIENIKTLQK